MLLSYYFKNIIYLDEHIGYKNYKEEEQENYDRQFK